MHAHAQTMRNKTAAMLVIGDEILSGRTQDTNSNYIARFLGALGIDLKEIRVVADIEDEIVAGLNALRARYDLVFTTGGIGPTHDDITADAVAKAFGVGIGYHPEAYALLEARYAPGEFNEMRKRMARIPHGAALIKNTVSVAPGFHIGNVYVMAGRADGDARHDGSHRAGIAARHAGDGRDHLGRSFPKAPSPPGLADNPESPCRCRHRLLSVLQRQRPGRAAGSARPRSALRWNRRRRRSKRCCRKLGATPQRV